MLDPDAAAFVERHRLPDTSLSALSADRRVLEDVAAGVAQANARLSAPEQIQRRTRLDAQWLSGGDELTPTMRLQRRPIMTKYAAAIEALYRS